MQILEFRKIDKPGSVIKASFKVHIPEWDFYMYMIYLEGSHGNTWFGYPSREYKNDQGERKFQWLAYFGEKAKSKFEETLRKEIKPFLGSEMTTSQPLNLWEDGEIPF